MIIIPTILQQDSPKVMPAPVPTGGTPLGR
jgi:hypothetical protein